MNPLAVINKCFRIIILFGFFHATTGAQTLRKHYLLGDIEALANSNPEQALKISQYLLSKTTISERNKSQIIYLTSKAYIAKGDYSSALNQLYEAKNYKQYLTEAQCMNIEVSKITLLRHLELDRQSRQVLDNLEKFRVSDDTLETYRKVLTAIEKSKFLLKENQAEAGIALLKSEKASVDGIASHYNDVKLNYARALGQLYLKQKNLREAQNHFRTAMRELNRVDPDNIYTKGDILLKQARVQFLKKDYAAATALSGEAATLIEKLGNNFLLVKVNELEGRIYLATKDVANYKLINSKFFDLLSESESLEQEAINTSYNLISDEYSDSYSTESANYRIVIYGFLAVLILAVLLGLFFVQKQLAHKKKMIEITNYIEITRSNLINTFGAAHKKQDKNEQRKNIILKETEAHILNKLKRFENSKRFLNKDISLAVLAGQLDSNTKYLSEIINTHYNVNFNTYINTLRVNYIIEKLKTDPNYINYKISYLAETCGFSSHSSFATVFKSITGISPVKFIELLNQEKENTLLEYEA